MSCEVERLSIQIPVAEKDRLDLTLLPPPLVVHGINSSAAPSPNPFASHGGASIASTARIVRRNKPGPVVVPLPTVQRTLSVAPSPSLQTNFLLEEIEEKVDAIISRILASVATRCKLPTSKLSNSAVSSPQASSLPHNSSSSTPLSPNPSASLSTSSSLFPSSTAPASASSASPSSAPPSIPSSPSSASSSSPSHHTPSRNNSLSGPSSSSSKSIYSIFADHVEDNTFDDINKLDPFCLELDEILFVMKYAQRIFAKEPTVVHVGAPSKVFGDIHGQIKDLLRHFANYGGPADDIMHTNYLFLGDLVDRSFHGLEVVCLLFALKIKHPGKVFLVRGNHEDPEINSVYGFVDELSLRLPMDQAEIVCDIINDVFSYMPLGALVGTLEKGNRIFCVHGGLGPEFTSVSQLQAIKRPIKSPMMDANSNDLTIVRHALWADPTDSMEELGYHSNEMRGSGVPAFGPDIVRKFCAENRLDLIIRAHECVSDGFQAFADFHLLTIFSATNYCNRMKNNGAHLHVDSDLRVQPCIIESPSELHTSLKYGGGSERPPTPPKQRKS